MKKNGFLLVELIISIAFIMIICITVFSSAIHINSLSNKKISDDNYNKDLALIYKEIGHIFSTENIDTINYDEEEVDGGKTIYYDFYSKGNPLLSIDFYNNALLINNQKFKSNKDIKYTNISVQRLVSSADNNYSYIILSIDYETFGKEETAKIYYVNNPVPVTNVSGIETIEY